MCVPQFCDLPCSHFDVYPSMAEGIFRLTLDCLFAAVPHFVIQGVFLYAQAVGSLPV